MHNTLLWLYLIRTHAMFLLYYQNINFYLHKGRGQTTPPKTWKKTNTVI